jgi:hypothetical protein
MGLLLRRTVPDADAAAWLNAVRAAGGQVSNTQDALVSAMIRSLKSAGVWTSLDRLWLFASENSTQALTDLKARSVATAVNSPTFTANVGYKGNGTTSYVDTNFNTLSSGVNFTQDSGHFSVWQNVAKTTGSDGLHGNVNTDAGTNGVFVDFSAGVNTAVGRVNAASGAAQTVTGGVGHLLANRTGATTAHTWYNGSKGALSTTASQTRQNLTLWFGGRNFAGSINQASDAGGMALSVGGGLTDAQVGALYAALLTYKNAVGA